MYRNSSAARNQPSLAQAAFLAQCNRAIQVPFVAPSDQVLDDYLTIINLSSQASGLMPGDLTKPMLQEMEAIVHGSMYQACTTVIASSSFNQLISTLKLTAQKAQLLSMRKLGSLLTIEMAMQLNQSSVRPASPVAVARLFERLDSIGISFETLADIEDKKFELIVSAAAQLLHLSDENVPLNKLLELSYLQAWALSMPSAVGEHESITTNRQQAIDFLNTHSLSNAM